MGIKEDSRRHSPSTRKRNVLEVARDAIAFRAVSMTGPVVRMGMERIAQAGHIEYEAGFWEKYHDAIAEGRVPILISNHQSHVDGTTISFIARDLALEGGLPGFALPLAMSLANGDQGAAMQAIYETQYPILIKNNLIPLLITREKDREKYGTTENFLSAFTKLVSAIKEGYGIAEFPEGTTTGGKKNKKGELNGMQQIHIDSLRIMLLAVSRAGKKAVIIPVGMSGGSRIHNPDRRLPTTDSLRVGLGRARDSLFSANVGLPIKPEEGLVGRKIEYGDWVAVNQLIMRQISATIPPEEQGFYAHLD